MSHVLLTILGIASPTNWAGKIRGFDAGNRWVQEVGDKKHNTTIHSITLHVKTRNTKLGPSTVATPNLGLDIGLKAPNIISWTEHLIAWITATAPEFGCNFRPEACNVLDLSKISSLEPNTAFFD
jgi:hypothetical protein